MKMSSFWDLQVSGFYVFYHKVIPTGFIGCGLLCFLPYGHPYGIYRLGAIMFSTIRSSLRDFEVGELLCLLP